MSYHKEIEIVQWAIDKGIIDKGDTLAQSFKTVEEVAELMKNFAKNRSIKDDIGDIYVTIVVQAFMQGYNMSRYEEEEEDPQVGTKDLLGYLIMDVAMMIDNIQTGDHLGIWISRIYNELVEICKNESLDINECIDIAYDEIKGRTGVMLNGVFVKDNG